MNLKTCIHTSHQLDAMLWYQDFHPNFAHILPPSCTYFTDFSDSRVTALIHFDFSVYTPLLGVVYEKTQRGQQWSTKYCASRRSRVHNISYSTVARVGFFHAPRPGEVCIQFTPRHISHFVSSKNIFQFHKYINILIQYIFIN